MQKTRPKKFKFNPDIVDLKYPSISSIPLENIQKHIKDYKEMYKNTPWAICG